MAGMQADNVDHGVYEQRQAEGMPNEGQTAGGSASGCQESESAEASNLQPQGQPTKKPKLHHSKNAEHSLGSPLAGIRNVLRVLRLEGVECIYEGVGDTGEEAAQGHEP